MQRLRDSLDDAAIERVRVRVHIDTATGARQNPGLDKPVESLGERLLVVLGEQSGQGSAGKNVLTFSVPLAKNL
jgi:hypothetical protein